MGLLKGVPPLLSADLLYVLRLMGHGDKLAVVDCNFPAASTAAKTTTGKCIVVAAPIDDVLDAICEVLPLDFFVDSPVRHMAPQPGVALPPAGVEVAEHLKAAVQKHAPHGRAINITPLDRFKFYDESEKCFAVVHTLERRPYGNVILTKGVVGPDGNDLMPS